MLATFLCLWANQVLLLNLPGVCSCLAWLVIATLVIPIKKKILKIHHLLHLWGVKAGNSQTEDEEKEKQGRSYLWELAAQLRAPGCSSFLRAGPCGLGADGGGTSVTGSWDRSRLRRVCGSSAVKQVPFDFGLNRGGLHIVSGASEARSVKKCTEESCLREKAAGGNVH